MNDKLLREALEIGLAAAQSYAADYHLKLRGYYPKIHKEVDDDVRKIEAAIAGLPSGTIASQLDSATAQKIAYLTDKGMKPIGVAMLDADGNRATVIMGRVIWSSEEKS